MAVQRRFLGWDEPVVTALRRHLLGDGTPEPGAPAGTLLLVPTQQSGRRLRQALTSWGTAHGVHTGYIRPRLPIDLVRDTDDDAVASSIESLALWARLLLNVDFGQLTFLFPSRDGERGFPWAMATSRLIQTLRSELAGEGLTIRRVASDFAETLEEPERWRELAWLEEQYLALVELSGRRDACESRVHRAASPHVPDGITKIVLACAPDPEPVALQALDRLAQDLPIDVLIHAPSSLANRFDGWGRATPEAWRDAVIDIPSAKANIRLAGTPAEQARLLISILASEGWGPYDTGVGAPDPDIIPFLTAEMHAAGLATYDPDGKPLSHHPLYDLVERYRALLDNGSYASVASFLHHPDVLEYLTASLSLTPRTLLRELDEFQNRHLPSHLGDMRRSLSVDDEFGSLSGTIDHLDVLALEARHDAPTAALRRFLQTVFSNRRLSADSAPDTEFATVAEHVAELLDHLDESCIPGLGFSPAEARSLLLDGLRPQRYEAPRQGPTIDIEGWLELHWNDAPLLIVTGMNEGRVPDGLSADPFLPNALRRQLGLRCDEDRYARDLYLLQAMLESRRTTGRLCLISGKTGASGDPLKPSRLLFACSDADLPCRARALFGAPERREVNHPATTSFLLRPSPPSDVPATRRDVSALAVTAFRDYLACPFRFYLKRVLGMESLDDLKTEMDAADFGALIHDVLLRMGQDEQLRACSDASRLTGFLHDEAERWAAERFGTPLRLNLRMQLDSARERLAAVARVQAAEAAAGWDIVAVEHPVEQTIEGMRVFGRVDRLDRHRDTGEVRVLDYKTSDNPQPPEKEHLKGLSDETPDYARAVIGDREYRWVDLQLPLYAFMLGAEDPRWAAAVPGYFNIPRTADDTRVKLWDSFSGAVAESAAACARGVALAIRSRIFWPPTHRVPFDDFETLFHTEAAACIDLDSFTSYMEAHE